MHTCKYKHKHTCMYEHTYIYTHAHNLWEQASKGGSRFTMRSEPESRFTVQLLCCLGQVAQSLCLHSFLRHCISELLEHLRERGSMDSVLAGLGTDASIFRVVTASHCCWVSNQRQTRKGSSTKKSRNAVGRRCSTG